MKGVGENIDASVALLIYWAAGQFGELTLAQERFLENKFPQFDTDEYIANQLPEFLQGDCVEGLSCSLRHIQDSFDEGEIHFMMELLCGVAGADGEVRQQSIHILFFLADFFGISREELRRIYLKMNSAILPEPGDPGSIAWWEMEEEKSQTGTHQTSLADTMSSEKALKVLGLPSNANPKAIKAAYRRLAQHFHPDRYQSKDAETQQKAKKAFILVQKAYEVLRP